MDEFNIEELTARLTVDVMNDMGWNAEVRPDEHGGMIYSTDGGPLVVDAHFICNFILSISKAFLGLLKEREPKSGNSDDEQITICDIKEFAREAVQGAETRAGLKVGDREYVRLLYTRDDGGRVYFANASHTHLLSKKTINWLNSGDGDEWLDAEFNCR